MKYVFQPRLMKNIHTAKRTYSQLASLYSPGQDPNFIVQSASVIDEFDTPTLPIYIDASNHVWLAVPSTDETLLIVKGGHYLNLHYLASGVFGFHPDIRQACLRLRRSEIKLQEHQHVNIRCREARYVLQVIAAPNHIRLLTYIGLEHDSLVVVSSLLEAKTFANKKEALAWWSTFQARHPLIEVAVRKLKMGI